MNLPVKILIILVVVLMLLGSIMVFTASGTYSYFKYNSDYQMFLKHFVMLILAVIALLVASKINYDNYKHYSKPALLFAVALLVVTLIIGVKIKGAHRWIGYGQFSFQPAELAKVILIMHISFMLEKMGDKIKSFKEGFIYPLIWIGIVAALVIAQPNVSTTIIIVVTSFVLIFVAGAEWKHIIGIFASAGFVVGTIGMILKHSRERILTYINSLLTGSDINVQVTQAKIALGSGYLVGIGPGHSRQSDLFLPEPYADFIFSIIGEELGIAGTVATLFLYFALFLVCMVIAKKAQDKFGQLLVIGLAFNIVISAFINAGVVTGLLPTTGITLPFISWGGTSIIIFAISVGIIVNVGRQSIRTQELKGGQVS
jgi:cell division protein FtsW